VQSTTRLVASVDTTSKEDEATCKEVKTTCGERKATCREEMTTGEDDETTFIEDRTTWEENQTTCMEDKTTFVKNDTTFMEGMSTNRPNETRSSAAATLLAGAKRTNRTVETLSSAAETLFRDAETTAGLGGGACILDRMRGVAWSAALLALLGGCKPSTIAEAERKGDVAWLDQNGTPDAVAALGRLSDTNPKAVTALEARSAWDVQAFKAAWAGVLRGMPWGSQMLRDGLADPKRADLAASAVDKHDPRLVVFVPDLEAALDRLSASMQNFNVSSTLASIGPAAHDALVRRLADASTRGAMCRGIAAQDASADARKTLVQVPVESRNADGCVDAVVHVAAEDEATLDWLGDHGEPGLLGAAGKLETLPCPKLHVVWTRVLAARTPDEYSALTVPLGYAIKRCTSDMDGVIADSIVHLPATHAFVVEAIDPFDGYGSALRATCAALPRVAGDGRDTPVIRERATDALYHGCKAPG
jgi:hypothetical protein